MRAYKYGGKQYLTGGQPKLDKNNDGVLNEVDFTLMRELKKKMEGGKVYMKGGKMYEEGGPLEEEAKAPEEVKGLLEALESGSVSGRDVKEMMERLRKEKQQTSFSGDFRDPNLLFNKEDDAYAGLDNVSDKGRAKAEAFYEAEIEKLKNRAYTSSRKPAEEKLPPRLEESEFADMLRKAIKSGKL